MGLPNLSGSNIQDTYQRVLQKAGTDYYDGTGSAFITDGSGNAPDNSGILVYNPNGNVGGKLIADSGFTYTGNVLSAQCEEINFTAASTGIDLIGSITASGDISASGDIIARNIIPSDNPSSGLRFNSTSTEVLSNLDISGSVTASGNISASGTMLANQLQLNEYLHWGATNGDNGYIYDDGDILQLGYNDSEILSIHDTTPHVSITGNLRVFGTGVGNITASGNISSSGTITGIIDGGSF